MLDYGKIADEVEKFLSQLIAIDRRTDAIAGDFFDGLMADFGVMHYDISDEREALVVVASVVALSKRFPELILYEADFDQVRSATDAQIVLRIADGLGKEDRELFLANAQTAREAQIHLAPN